MKTGVYLLKQNNKVVYVGATQKWPETVSGFVSGFALQKVQI